MQKKKYIKTKAKTIAAAIRAILTLALILGLIKGYAFNKPVFAVYTDERENWGKEVIIGNYVPGEIIVKYKKGKTPKDLKIAASVRAKRADEFLGRLINKWENYRLSLNGEKPPEEVLKLAREIDKDLKIKSKSGIFDEYYIVKSEEKLPPSFFTRSYRQLDNIEIVEPNYLYHTMAEPNDTHYVSGKMWGMNKISASAAWDKSTGSYSVKAAVVDSGIEPEHEDLKGNFSDFVDIAGCRGRYSTGHGTHTSGTIGAVGNNNTGVVGVNWKVGLIGVNASCTDSLSVGLVAKGIDYAVEKGAKVINLSLGGSYSNVIDSAIGRADSAGVLVVVSAGNTRGPYADQFYPARDPRVITVSATGPNDELARYSSYGNAVDVAAPGGNPPGGSRTCARDASDCIVSAWLNNGYAAIAGTSMAAPHVTGLVALIYSANPGLSPDEVKNIIYSTADDLGDPGKDARFGHGRINAGAALAAAGAGSGEPTPTTAAAPTKQPTQQPTQQPTKQPTQQPTQQPTKQPTQQPTAEPTIIGEPTNIPTATKNPSPIPSPTSVIEPSSTPTVEPPSPTPVVITCSVNGDYNGDGTLDITDYSDWKIDYLSGKTALSCFEYWRRSKFEFGAPTTEPTETFQPSPTPKSNATPIPGNSFSYAVRFAGTLVDPDYIRVEDSSSLKAKPEMTVEGWIKIMGENTEEIPRYQTFISKKNQHIPQLPYWLLVDGERKLRYGACWAWEPIDDCISHSDNQGQTPLEKNRWYHIALVWKNNTIKVYLDGKIELIFNHSYPIDNSEAELPIFIGAYCLSTTCNPPGTGFLFQGEIDEVRISDTVRYTEEFSPPTAPFIPDNNTIALWHFDEGTGTVVEDASGNGNNGRLIGGARFVESSLTILNKP